MGTFDGFNFGMTVEEATAVKPGSAYAQCGFRGVVGCIEYETTVSAVPATVDVQFNGNPPRVIQIVLMINSLQGPGVASCSSVTQGLRNWLVRNHGIRFRVIKNSAVWTRPNGGLVELLALCTTQSKGVNVISYRP
jgi:hypothetical protein